MGPAAGRPLVFTSGQRQGQPRGAARAAVAARESFEAGVTQAARKKRAPRPLASRWRAFRGGAGLRHPWNSSCALGQSKGRGSLWW